MTSSSKVIKARCFSLSSPRVIRPWPEMSLNNMTGEPKDILDADEAQKIIAETEEMAQQLLYEAKERAEEFISKARMNAERIEQEAREKSRAIQEEAKKRGYEEGWQAGKDALAGERQKLQDEITRMREVLALERKRVIQQLEPELLELATVIARQILHTELTTTSDQIAAIARAAITRAQGAGEMILKINSADYDAISGLLAGDTQNVGRVRVEVDNSLHKGCLVETPFGTVDGTLEGQLQEVIDDLQEVSRSD